MAQDATRKCANVLIQHGIQERDWRKIEEAAELLDIPIYGAVTIARDAKTPDHKKAG